MKNIKFIVITDYWLCPYFRTKCPPHPRGTECWGHTNKITEPGLCFARKDFLVEHGYIEKPRMRVIKD